MPVFIPLKIMVVTYSTEIFGTAIIRKYLARSDKGYGEKKQVQGFPEWLGMAWGSAISCRGEQERPSQYQMTF